MAKLELHLSQSPYVELDDEPVSGEPSKWSVGEIVPHIADVPDDLVLRYKAVMGKFWDVQEELRKLYDEGVPADAVRPQ